MNDLPDPLVVSIEQAPKRLLLTLLGWVALLPLPASAVRSVVKSVESFAFDRIYGGWTGTRIERDAKDVLARSAKRYIAALEG